MSEARGLALVELMQKEIAAVQEKISRENKSQAKKPLVYCARGSSIALIKFDKGASIPEPHLHASNQFMFCLSGRYEYTKTGVVLTAGSFYCNPKGHVHGPAIAHEDTVVVEIYDGPHYPQKPSWYTDEQDAR